MSGRAVGQQPRLRVAAIGVVAALLAGLGATSARPAVVQLGPSNLHETEEDFSCETLPPDNGCTTAYTIAQEAPASSSFAPAAGVVTSWAIKGFLGDPSLQVLQHTAGGWRVAGTSTPATDLNAGQNATELPIEAGDLIGLLMSPQARPAVYVEKAVPGAEVWSWNPALDELTGRNPGAQEPYEIEVNAQVELAPVITSVSPASGGIAGGNTVTIAGEYLDSVDNVVFGSLPATTFKYDPITGHISATAPAEKAGSVDITLRSVHVQSEPVAADRYTFLAAGSTGGGGAPSGPGSGSGGPGTSNGAPVVSGFTQTAAAWRAGTALPHITRIAIGTTFAFSLDRQAAVALSFHRRLQGRRVAGHCLAPSHANSRAPRCKRSVADGALAVDAQSGLNRVRFQGRLSSARRLAPGAYSVAVTTGSGHALKTLTKSLDFTILP